jgi:leader peptidase (prepilin peptidase)/N-methyltransferase
MVPFAFWVVTAFLLGITIGSFLTAVIYRLARPEEHLSLLEPQRSMCPNCKHSLSPIDLVPLFSFLMFGRKCHYCKAPISWRYFGVELLTGLTFVAITLKFPHDIPTLAAMLAFAAVLIPIFFIDLESYHIPTSLNLLATVIPLLRDAWGITHHQAGFELLWGWLPRTILGGIIGALIFGLVRIAGWLYKGVEAMGLGDVFLARGMGAMFLVVMPVELGYWPFPLWVILSCVSGIIVYPVFVAVDRAAQMKNLQQNSDKKRDRYGNTPADVESIQDKPDEKLKRKGTLGEQLRDLAQVLWGYDAYDWTRYTFDRKYRHRTEAEANKFLAEHPEELEWTPAPTAIPFGPFLVVGFLLTVFCGEAMILWYLDYAHLRPGPDTANS